MSKPPTDFSPGPDGRPLNKCVICVAVGTLSCLPQPSIDVAESLVALAHNETDSETETDNELREVKSDTKVGQATATICLCLERNRFTGAARVRLQDALMRLPTHEAAKCYGLTIAIAEQWRDLLLQRRELRSLRGPQQLPI